MKTKQVLYLFFLLVIIFNLCACTPNKEREREISDNNHTEIQINKEEVVMREIPITLIDEEATPGDWGQTVNVYFLTSADASENEIMNHALNYINERHDADSTIYKLRLFYYDSEVFYRYGDCELALVVWGPNKNAYEARMPEEGDFSSHFTHMSSYYGRNKSYELSEDEIKEYIRFQNMYYKLAGEYADWQISKWTLTHLPEFDIYKIAAKELDISVDELVDLRIKVSMYCGNLP